MSVTLSLRELGISFVGDHRVVAVLVSCVGHLLAATVGKVHVVGS